MTELQKKLDHAFGKNVYFLGIYNEDEIWLEAASWDCDWYWGFGYIEVYDRKQPSKATDIISHSHYDQFFEKGHILSDFKVKTPLTESEQWILSDLMKSAYTLQKTAEVLGRGYSHLTAKAKSESLIKEDWVKEINEVLLPEIFEKVYKLLSPE